MSLKSVGSDPAALTVSVLNVYCQDEQIGRLCVCKVAISLYPWLYMYIYKICMYMCTHKHLNWLVENGRQIFQLLLASRD